jgi:hypothetical protein
MLEQHRAYLPNEIDTQIQSRIRLKGLWSLTTVVPHMLIDQPYIPCRVHVAVPQDRASAARDATIVLLWAELDPVGTVDVGREGLEAPRAALARPKCINDLDAAPLGDLPPWPFHRTKLRSRRSY